MIKFGLILPTYVDTPYRKEKADAFFASLLDTELRWAGVINKVVLYMLIKPTDYVYPISALTEKFELRLVERTGLWADLTQSENTIVYGTSRAFRNHEITHAVHLGDDAIFSHKWLCELRALIRRHPKARSWNIYRSARVDIHETLNDTSEDVLVKSCNGNGMTFSREEWEGWNLDYRQGNWRCPHGGTLDLVHVCDRPGERWVTKRSWMEHAGQWGSRSRPEYGEKALNFVGVGR